MTPKKKNPALMEVMVKTVMKLVFTRKMAAFNQISLCRYASQIVQPTLLRQQSRRDFEQACKERAAR